MNVTNVLESISIIIAACVVIFGINAWRREYVGKRKLELAEEVLALFYEARDAIGYIRNPFGYVGEGGTRKADQNESSEEKQINDKAYVVFERYNKRQNLFNKLYSMRYRYIAQFGKDTAKPFDELNKIVNDIFTSARMLPHYWKQQGHHQWKNESEFQHHLEEMHKYEAIFWYQGENRDSIGPRVNEVISEIEAQSLIIIGGTHIMKNNFIKWAKWITKYYIWAFGLMLAHLAVIKEVIVLPNSQSQLQLLILLYIFDAALIITFIIDIYQKNSKNNKKDKLL
jgi:hypothetical protein